jgi:hypothetical protein
MNPKIVTRLILLSLALALTNCAHGPCKVLGSLFGCRCVERPQQSEFQDMRIQLPVFDSMLKTDASLDGYMLQAIRIAADDLLPPEEPDLPCIYQKSSYRYQAVRQGEVIFVRVDFDPQSCGGAIDMLDGGATYAINVEGRILRRAVDGAEPFHESPPAPAPERGAPATDTPASSHPDSPSLRP